LTAVFRTLLLALCAFGLLACGTTTPLKFADEGQHETRAVFKRSGRFALSAENRLPDNPDAIQAVQGGFNWREDGDTLNLDFTSPLGATLAQVRIEPRQAWLQTAHGEELSATSAEELVEHLFGAAIPVTQLRHWLRGKLDGEGIDPATQTDNVQYDAQGRLTRFRQHGWQVSLSRHDGATPRLLRLERHTPNQILKLRLVVDTD